MNQNIVKIANENLDISYIWNIICEFGNFGVNVMLCILYQSHLKKKAREIGIRYITNIICDIFACFACTSLTAPDLEMCLLICLTAFGFVQRLIVNARDL